MVIDLTRRPVFINTDICTKHVVVRTASTQGASMDAVNGRIARSLPKSQHRFHEEESAGQNLAYVKIGASKKSPQSTLMECRLPVQSIVGGLSQGLLFDPYEVATLYLDSFTNKRGVWRAQLMINSAKNVNGTVWLITVRDEEAKVNLVTATLKEPPAKQKTLFVKPPGRFDRRGTSANLTAEVQAPQDFDDLLPLERIGVSAPGSVGPRSVWDLIRAIQYDSVDG